MSDRGSRPVPGRGTIFAILAWPAILSQVIVCSMVLAWRAGEEEHGTVVVEIEVPRLERGVPLDATRDGESYR